MYMYQGTHVIYMHDRCTTCICVQHVTIIDNLLSDSLCKSTTKVRSLFWSHFLHSCYGIKVVINGCTSPSFFHTYIADYWCCVCMGSSQFTNLTLINLRMCSPLQLTCSDKQLGPRCYCSSGQPQQAKLKTCHTHHKLCVPFSATSSSLFLSQKSSYPPYGPFV